MRASASATFPSAVILAAALVGAIGIPGQSFGLNVVATAAIGLAGVGLTVHREFDKADGGLFVLGIVTLAFFLMRTTSWVLMLDLIAGLLVIGTAIARARRWRAVLVLPASLARRLIRGLIAVMSPLATPLVRRPRDELTPILRAAGYSALLTLVFAVLFVTADRAFAAFTERFVVPDWNLYLLPARVFVAIACIAVFGALMLLSPALSGGSPTDGMADQGAVSRFALRPMEWKAILISLDVLFAAFVIVQIAVLFGGHRHVLETEGLSYAEYARQGFFQLIVVAFLTLGVIGAVVAFGETGDRDRRLMKVLLAILSAATLVILASALTRMNLYQEAYGFTRLRLLVDTTILWLAGLFVLVLVAGLYWNGKWLPRAVVVLSAVAVIGLSLHNPDARIAERNVDRFDRTGDIDLAYLASLSPDALPALIQLPEPQRSCAVVPIVSRMNPRPSIWSFNFGRERALDATRSFDPEGDQCAY